jgi:hypothetical protein
MANAQLIQPGDNSDNGVHIHIESSKCKSAMIILSHINEKI